MLRTHGGIIQPGGNGMRSFDLPFSVHQDIRHAALQHAESATGETCSVFALGDAATAGFDSDEADARFIEEFEEGTNGIGTAADAGDDGVRQATFGPEDLLLGFDGDDAMKIANHHRIRVRAVGRT